MSGDQDRYHWTYDSVTGEPIGMLDTWYSPQGVQGAGHAPTDQASHQQVPAYQPAVYQAPQVIPAFQQPQMVQVPAPTYRPAPRISYGYGEGRARAFLYLAGFLVAAGMFAGFLLFGDRTPPTPVVMVCSAPQAYPFAQSSGPAMANCSSVTQPSTAAASTGVAR